MSQNSICKYLKTFAIHTLGCKVNTYESESMANQLRMIGLVEVDFNKKADVYIINTCSVTNVADAKSRNIISRARKKNENAIIIVAGCYSQTASKEIFQKLNVDIVIGNKYKNDILGLLDIYFSNNKKKYIKIENLLLENEFEKIELDDYKTRTRAFIKIQDGCNFMCSYCSIPFTRGKQRSASLENILNQIQKFIENDFKEIVLTGVNTAGYLDKDNNNFYTLLKSILNIQGDFRVRISSLEPFQITDELIELITNNKHRFCSHWHICLQSGSNNTLKDMNRKYSIEEFRQLINKIRNNDNLVSISTDIIVGFPTETEADFIQSYNFINDLGFSFLHVFPFSKRNGTKAATLKETNDSQVKNDRVKKMLKLSNQLNVKYIKQFIGKDIYVLFEKRDGDFLVGKSSQYFDVYFKMDNDDFLNKICRLKCKKVIGSHVICELP